jgi:hypothetical protein
MSFWGTEVKPDKVVPFVPPPQDARLHISQACLAPGAGQYANQQIIFTLNTYGTSAHSIMQCLF